MDSAHVRSIFNCKISQIHKSCYSTGVVEGSCSGGVGGLCTGWGERVILSSSITEFLWWVLVVEAGGDVGQQGLVPWGQTSGWWGGQGVRVPRGQVRLVLWQGGRPVVVREMVTTSCSTCTNSTARSLVGFQMVAGRWCDLTAGLVLASQVERGHRLVVRG